MKRLTPKQREVVEAVAGLFAETGRPPSHRQIGARLGISHASAWERTQACVRKGALVKVPGVGSVVPAGERSVPLRTALRVMQRFVPSEEGRALAHAAIEAAATLVLADPDEHRQTKGPQ